MSTTKQYLKGDAKCKIRFKAGKEIIGDAATCSVVGTFNDWDPKALTMKKLKDGSFSAAVNLDAPATYEYRFLADNERWITDMETDGVTEGPYADAQNSILKV